MLTFSLSSQPGPPAASSERRLPRLTFRRPAFLSTTTTTTTTTTPTTTPTTTATAMATMAASVASAPDLPRDPAFVGTIPDPRGSSNGCVTPTRQLQHSTHPDLNVEVAALSNKLIDAINHQTTLDDSLADTRHELEAARDRVRQLEAEAARHADLLATGLLLPKAEVDGERSRCAAALDDERRQRAAADKDKKSIELELESLTTALFEEANKMVSAARQERDATERKNEQLRAKLADVEVLLASHQEQLSELKSVMQHMSSDRGDLDSTNVSTAPSTPGFAHHEHPAKVADVLHLSPPTPGAGDVPPSHPTSFSHLIQPVLRTDLHAYDDFAALLQIARNAPSPSRASSGSYGGLNVMGLGALGAGSPTVSLGSAPSNGSTSSLGTVGTGTGTVASSPATPSTPASSVGPGPLRDVAGTPLKETRFYKRVLAEDVEPTLRLDTAPGLSWLARRAVLNAMCDGSLVVEPLPPARSAFVFCCSLCNENRKGEEHARRHRFRTSESDSAQRYPLCRYCLGRVRSSCDFLGFLRMVKDGHWRTEGREGERGAWEESVRLRESMFWARIGGGVVPASAHAKDSRRNSSNADRQDEEPKDQARQEEPSPKPDEDVFRAEDKTSLDAEPGEDKALAPEEAIAQLDFAPTDLDTQGAVADSGDVQTNTTLEEAGTEATAEPGEEPVEVATTDAALGKGGESAELARPDTADAKSVRSSRGENRLSITIPGAFE
ncbi:MAG: rab guanine nucleotide exchange factor S2 [Thelocarpon impressellum]|nr:MAG: rab guanine nucleotide exchange factor S2 [Thelocarpon impressellum]